MANVFNIKTFAQILNNLRKPIVWIFAVLFSFAFAVECFGTDEQSPETIIIEPPKVVDRPDFTFHFSGADARTKKENLQYSWRFDQKEWTPFSQETSAHLKNLTDGLHLFEVRAKNEAGIIDSTPAQVWFEVAIEKEPPETTILPSFKITRQSLENLKSEGVTDDVLKKLENIKNQEITEEEKFVDILKKTLGEEQTDKFRSLILKHALNPPKVIKIPDVTFKFSGEDAQTKKENLLYSWRLDGKEWSKFSKETEVALNIRDDGMHLFEVRAKDEAGNIDATPDQFWFEVSIDKEPPETKILNPPEVVRTVDFIFTFKGNDNVTDTEDLQYSWRLDGGEWKPFSRETNAMLNNLTDGTHLFEVNAKDEAGNEDLTPAKAPFVVEIDPLRPPVIVERIPPDSPLKSADVTFNFHVDGANVQMKENLEYSWRLDSDKDQDWLIVEGTSVELKNLTNGRHQFEVRAVDKSGRVKPTPAQTWFEVDVVVPPLYKTSKFWYSVATILGLISIVTGILTVLYLRFIGPLITTFRRFNPYQDILVDDEKIYGRDKLLNEIIDSLHNGNNIMLYGERQIGKTILLRQLEKRLKEPFIPIYIDVGNIPEELFLVGVMKEIVENRHINRDELELQIEQDRAKYNSVNFREDFEKILSQLQKRYDEDAMLVLLLDEIDVMINYKVVPATLRKLLTVVFKGQLRMVSAGRNVTQIDSESLVSPLFNVFRFFEISPLSHEDAENLIKEPVRQYIEYSDEAVKNIITYTGSRPRHILVFCGYIVEGINFAQKFIAILTHNKVKVDSEKVQQVFESKMSKEPVFQAYWNNLPKETQNAIFESRVFQQAWNILQEGRLIDNTGKLTHPFQEWIKRRQS